MRIRESNKEMMEGDVERDAYEPIKDKRVSAYLCMYAGGNTKTIYMSYLGKNASEDMSAGVPLSETGQLQKKKGIDKLTNWGFESYGHKGERSTHFHKERD